MKMTDYIFMIDLSQFKETDPFLSKLEIANFLVSCGINQNLEEFVNDLYCAKNGIEVLNKPFTKGNPWNKIWLFKDTYKIMGGENSDGKNFTSDFLQFLLDMESIKPIQKIFISENTISLDDVLDKISKTGMNSLTPRELEILKNV